MRLALAAAAIAALAGCQSLQSSDGVGGLLTPYKMEIVQGNVITSEQAAAIKPGLSRAQVRDVLGSPLLADPFHANRWDYVFTIRRQGADPQLRRVVVLFKDDKLESIDTGAPLPAEREFITSIATFKDSGAGAHACPHRGAGQGPAGAGEAAAAGAGAAGTAAQLPAARAAPMTGPAGRQRVAIAGASGRMGHALIEAVTASPDLALSGALDVAGGPGIGKDATEFLGQKSGVLVDLRPARRPRQRRRADRLHPSRRHAGAPGGLPRARRQRGRRHDRVQRRRRRQRSPAMRSGSRSSWHPT